MSEMNRVSASVSSDDVAAVMAAVATIKEKLPFLFSLEPGESRELPKLGPRTLSFDERCTTYMEKHPEFIPAFIDAVEVNKDRLLRTRLADVSRTVSLLAGSIEDTLAVVSHEIYNADLAFYQNVKQAAKRGVLNAQTIFIDLSQRFPGRNSVKAAGDSAAKATVPLAS